MAKNTAETLTTAEVAKQLKTDGRTLRRFLRSTKQGVGTGKRYAFTAKDVPSLKQGFTAWREGAEAAKGAETHTCEHCSKEFKTASGLASHSRTHRDDEE